MSEDKAGTDAADESEGDVEYDVDDGWARLSRRLGFEQGGTTP